VPIRAAPEHHVSGRQPCEGDFVNQRLLKYSRVNDAERDHTFEHAEWVYSITQAWYRRCRYQLIELPKVSVAERCTFVLQALADSAISSGS
jgi:hypothetical protein